MSWTENLSLANKKIMQFDQMIVQQIAYIKKINQLSNQLVNQAFEHIFWLVIHVEETITSMI